MSKKSPKLSSVDKGISYALACAVVIVLIILVLHPRIMDSGTLAIVRFLAAVFAGICGYFFSGKLELEARVPLNKFQIRATGAFAAFIIVLFFFFIGVPSSSEKFTETEKFSSEESMEIEKPFNDHLPQNETISNSQSLENKKVQDLTYLCKRIDGIPTTVVRDTIGVERPIIVWISVPKFYDPTYTIEQRCQEVSKKFQITHEKGFKYIYPGKFGGYPAICITKENKLTEEIKSKPCTEENVLIILRSSDDPNKILENFFGLNPNYVKRTIRL